MTALAPQTVASVHWLNWLNTAVVIKDDNEIIAGTLTSVQYSPNGGLFHLTLGATVLRYTRLDQIIIATPAQAAPALYGVPLGQ